MFNCSCFFPNSLCAYGALFLHVDYMYRDEPNNASFTMRKQEDLDIPVRNTDVSMGYNEGLCEPKTTYLS